MADPEKKDDFIPGGCPRCGKAVRQSKLASEGPHKGMVCEDCALAEAYEAHE